MAQILIDFPSNTIKNGMCAADMALAASKHIRHQSVDVELYGPATSIAALTKWIHIVRGATGTLVGFEAAIAVLASDVSRTVTVDLHKSTGGGAFATVLTSTIGFTTSSTVRVPVAAVINTATLVDGDILAIVVTVAGGSGTQATGLMATLTMEEVYAP